jgi:hypothetical protein
MWCTVRSFLSILISWHGQNRFLNEALHSQPIETAADWTSFGQNADMFKLVSGQFGPP